MLNCIPPPSSVANSRHDSPLLYGTATALELVVQINTRDKGRSCLALMVSALYCVILTVAHTSTVTSESHRETYCNFILEDSWVAGIPRVGPLLWRVSLCCWHGTVWRGMGSLTGGTDWNGTTDM